VKLFLRQPLAASGSIFIAAALCRQNRQSSINPQLTGAKIDCQTQSAKEVRSRQPIDPAAWRQGVA